MRIIIYTNLLARIFFGRKLKAMKFNLKKDESGKYYQRHIEDNDTAELKSIKRFCRHRFLRVVLHDDSMERSTNYRNRFFRENRGLFGNGEYYLCAYCGKPLSKRKVRVDHIIPVYLASHSDEYKKMLLVKGIKNVNDPANLAASCARCNGRKGASGGLWVLRGYFGRSWVRVLFREVIFMVSGGLLLYWFYGFLTEHHFYDTAMTFYHFFF